MKRTAPSSLNHLHLLTLIFLLGLSSFPCPTAFAELPPNLYQSPNQKAPQPLQLWGTEKNNPDANQQPGLVLRLRSFANNDLVDYRVSRLAALAVPAGETPSPFLPAERFEAHFRGSIQLRLWRPATFWFHGRGKAILSINGKQLLKVSGNDLSKQKAKVRLETGTNRLSIAYRSPEKGDAEIRLLWDSSKHPPGDVPPWVFRHDATSRDLVVAQQRQRGRYLLAKQRCTACHTAPEFGKHAMPELEMDAPNLEKVGSRLKEKFLANWIHDPTTIRPNATMPRVLHTGSAGAETKAFQDAWDIAAFLSSRGKADTIVPPEMTNKANIAAGGHRFASLGCVACHIQSKEEKKEALTFSVVSLDYVKEKYHPKALIAFLQNPRQHYRWITMPDFRLSEKEATQLAAYLWNRKQKQLPDSPNGTRPNPQRGKKLYASVGCVNCHPGEKTSAILPKTQLHAATLRDIRKGKQTGCLAIKPKGQSPLFRLSKSDRLAIISFLETPLTSLTRRSALSFSHRRLDEMRCLACHARDGHGDRFSKLGNTIEKLLADLGDPQDDSLRQSAKNSFKQIRPKLTWAGEKLLPAWFGPFLAGDRTKKPRPWLHARMPSFPVENHLLAQGLAAHHGYLPQSPKLAKVDAQHAKTGAILIGEMGFKCVTCHGVADKKPDAVFEAPGVNLQLIPGRIRKTFYSRWMLNPSAIEKFTRMPNYTLPDGTTALFEYFDGEASDQYRAIWHRMLQLHANAKKNMIK